MNECRVKHDENNVAHMTYSTKNLTDRANETSFQIYKLPFPAVSSCTQVFPSVKMVPRHASVLNITGCYPLCAPCLLYLDQRFGNKNPSSLHGLEAFDCCAERWAPWWKVQEIVHSSDRLVDFYLFGPSLEHLRQILSEESVGSSLLNLQIGLSRGLRISHDAILHSFSLPAQLLIRYLLAEILPTWPGRRSSHYTLTNCPYDPSWMSFSSWCLAYI